MAATMLAALTSLLACSLADLTAVPSSDASIDEPSGTFDATATDAGVDTGSDAPSGEGEAAAPADADAASEFVYDASSWDAPAGPVMLQNALNREYLDVAGASLSNQAQIVTSNLTAGSDQYWAFKALGDGSYELVNSGSSKCLDDQGGLVGAGTTMIQFTCNADANQRWYLVDNQGSLTIVGQLSGRCLASQSLSDPDVIIIEDCSPPSQAQQWHIPH